MAFQIPVLSVIKFCSQIIHLYTFILEALDEDSSSDFVKFNITNPPKAGMIQKRRQGDSTGWNVHQFEQQDLNKVCFGLVLFFLNRRLPAET